MKDVAKAVMYSAIFLIPALVYLVSNSMFFPYITGKNFAFRILVEIAFVAWVVLAFYEPKYRPRFSWIFASFGTLIVVMLFANSFGQFPLQSFWNNFERMEGYVTLVHTFLYLVVLGSVMQTEKIWQRYFWVIMGVSIAVAIYAFRQLSGEIAINQGGLRLDATLGNSAYMAIYTFFLIFIGFFMFFKTKSVGERLMYMLYIMLFVFFMIQTATRGTTLGLVIGSFIMMGYIAFYAKDYPNLRKIAGGGVVALIAIVCLFIGFKESAFVTENPYLSRIATISLKEGTNRFNIWSMALEGVKERPLLGWGQSNYNYVFNQYYKPELHGQEAWFDRVHNIVIDWLIAGGIVGAVAYFAILASAMYYLFLRPLLREDTTFSVVERGVLIGMLAGYLVHNMFVFDNIVSYMFYGIVLAYIHSRVSVPVDGIANARIHTKVVDQVVVPVAAIALVLIVYFVNVPSIKAAQDIIDAFKTQDAEVQLEAFDRALSRGSFGNQEIREQLTQRVQGILQDPEASDEVKEKARLRVEAELLRQIEEKPGDAQVHVFVASFYRMSGRYDEAAAQLARARELSPNKQIIIFEQGYTELQRQDFTKALEFFKQAHELGPQFIEPRILYAMSAVYAGRFDLVDELIQTEDQKISFFENDQVAQALYAARQYDRLIELFSKRIELHPEDQQNRTSLAYLLNESGKKAEAIEVLKKAGEEIPSFKEQADGFIRSLETPQVNIAQ